MKLYHRNRRVIINQLNREQIEMKQIVYVMGRGHSGSTILDALLGNAPNTVGVGELVSGWNRIEGKCSCGATLSDCPFWKGVRSRYEQTASKDWKNAGDVSAWQANILRVGHTILKKNPHPDLVQMTTDAFECIGAEAGVENVVDSGKEFSRALFLLRRFKSAKVIFLIRRCDAVVASRLSRIKDGTGFLMLRKRSKSRVLAPLFLIVTTINWMIGNIIGECISWAYSGRVIRVRYEDLCKDTTGTLNRLGSFLEIDLSSVSTNVVEQNSMPIGHKIAGNRTRESGAFVFNPKLAKSRTLSKGYRILAWIVCAPLLWRYGYFDSEQNGPEETD